MVFGNMEMHLKKQENHVNQSTKKRWSMRRRAYTIIDASPSKNFELNPQTNVPNAWTRIWMVRSTRY